jgi:amidohydrolase
MGFLDEAKSLFDYTQRMRRDFHRHPELGFQEVRTSGIVAKEMEALGLEYQTGIAKTGVVALLEGARPGPVVLLRGDMDALPIVEETGAEYASQNPGVMHACGHDGHTAILLTVAKLLTAHRDQLAGTVKFVFQPAEEGMNGAEVMVKEGVLENPKVDYAIASHVWNDKPLKWFGVTEGPVMAGAEKFRVVITGTGGHGAAPHQTIDPIFTASQMITALQSIVSRNVPPLESAVVSVGKIQGGSAFNIIPPEVELLGTIRTFKKDVREKVLKRFREVVTGIAESLECRVEIELVPLTPAVSNSPELAKLVQETVVQLFPDATLGLNDVSMGSEDMAYIMEKVPGFYIFVGSADAERGLDSAHHHPKFDFDENALPEAVALMATVTAKILA